MFTHNTHQYYQQIMHVFSFMVALRPLLMNLLILILLTAAQACQESPVDAGISPAASKTSDFLFFNQKDDMAALGYMQTDGSHREMLTAYRTGMKKITVSPRFDVAYQVEENGEDSIFLVESDGRNNRFLVDGREPSWSPDGKELLCIRQNEIVSVTIETGAETTLRKVMEGRPHILSYSPNGDWIGFVVRKEDEDELWVMNSDGSHLRKIGGIDPIAGREFPWAFNGYGIYAVKYGDVFIYSPIIPAEGQGHRSQRPVILGTTVSRMRNPLPSPDGRILLLEAGNVETPDIYLFDLQKQDVRKVHTASGPISRPQFTRDGRHVIFSEDGPNSITTVIATEDLAVHHPMRSYQDRDPVWIQQ